MRQFLNSVAPTGAGWVRLLRATPCGRELTLHFAALPSRRHRRGAEHVVICRGVLEWRVTDLDAGGVRLYGWNHPAALQYVSPACRLALSAPAPQVTGLLGALAEAHARLVDDWIPVDRYLGSFDQLARRLRRGGRVVVKVPRFLGRVYEKAAQARGGAGLVSEAVGRLSGSRPRVLHFSNSYVVAAQFQVEHTKEAG